MSEDIVLASQFIIDKRKAAKPSPYELLVDYYLKERQIKFEREYFTPDGSLHNPVTKKLLFFDFYIPQWKIAIEYDGMHHRKPTKGYEAFSTQLDRDKIKNKYCKDNGIKMVRITATDYPVIEKQLKRVIDTALGMKVKAPRKKIKKILLKK